MDRDRASAIAKECGFTNHGFFEVKELRFLEQVRDMCAADRCQSYDKNWSCPPACGTIDEIKEKAKHYNWGIVLQVTGDMEDDFDVEAMMGNEQKLKDNLVKFCEKTTGEDMLPMSAGTCHICKECTYPDAPCRFPERMLTSMEAYGLVVSEVCEISNIPYYYGPKTITYTGCALFV